MEERVHRLTGPGVWDEPGAAHMGGKTPFRLADLGSNYFENMEESDLYKVLKLKKKTFVLVYTNVFLP
jgi:hypothetical protein